MWVKSSLKQQSWKQAPLDCFLSPAPISLWGPRLTKPEMFSLLQQLIWQWRNQILSTSLCVCFLKQILYCFVILHTFKSPFNLHNFGYDKTDERDSINKRDRRPTGYILDQMHPPKPQTFKQLVLSCLFSLAVMCSCMQNTWQMLAGVGWKKFALDDRTVLRVHSAWMSSRGAPNPSPHGYQKGDTKTKKKT